MYYPVLRSSLRPSSFFVYPLPISNPSRSPFPYLLIPNVLMFNSMWSLSRDRDAILSYEQGTCIYNKKCSKLNLWLCTTPTIQISYSLVCITDSTRFPGPSSPICPFAASIAAASPSSSRIPAAYSS